MPRTVEHIVACHNIASDRRAAGKPIWDKSINIKEILHRDQRNESNQHVAAVAAEIASLIRSSVPSEWLDIAKDDYDRELVEVVELLESVSAEGMEEGTLLEDFNDFLEQLYDWADYRRVWLG
ncbi:hypothetical protein [Cupriavidus sp. TMH.W2]|uniref:hypothetical protein n=1 Tax=Cupriavidus sp. TMH.W2 TaxID=3434465 RepID=UPI003D76C328